VKIGMLRRLVSFAERAPESAAKVIFALAVALSLVILGVLLANVGIGNLFESPYPSETTPLSWSGGSIVWTSVDTVVITGTGYVISTESADPLDIYAEYGGWGRNYSSMRFSWDDYRGTFYGSVANDSEQQELSLGVATTTETYIGSAFPDNQEVNYSLVVTDLQGNGAFDQGDQITFKTSSSTGKYVYDDDVYTIALAYVDSRYLYVGEFNFAFHEGEFYSWEGNVLDWSQPWWE
jgi:hypothetical protein